MTDKNGSDSNDNSDNKNPDSNATSAGAGTRGSNTKNTDKIIGKNSVSKLNPVNQSTNISKKTTKPAPPETETLTNQKESVATIDKTSPAELFNAKPMPKMPSNKNKRNWFIPGLIALLVIVALLASGWTVYQQYLFKQNWAEQQTKIETQIRQQSQVVEQAKISAQASVQAASQTQLQLNQLAAKNQQLNDSLLSTQEKIKALSGRQKQDWMLAEAAYLIKIAQLQLSLQKDKETATQLLKTADRRIIEIADNSLFPIREAIARDLSELSLILQPDVTGIALSLNAINQQISSLSLLALQFEPIEESLESQRTDSQGFDLDKIYQNFLTDFVVIKDHSEPVKPLMTADQRINLNSNIQLAIQQAQIALVQGNSPRYRLNISNAIEWTDRYFKHDEKAQQVVEQLNSLKTKPIEVHYPNKLHAQKALDEISQQQLYHWLESSLSPAVPKIKIDAGKTPSLEQDNIEPQQSVTEQSDGLEETQEQNQEGKP